MDTTDDRPDRRPRDGSGTRPQRQGFDPDPFAAEPRPPPQQRQAHAIPAPFSETGYQATPFDPAEQSSSAVDDDGGSASEWQHFPRRRAEAKSAPAPPQQQQQQRRESLADDPVDIDRLFQVHTRERRPPPPPFVSREQEREVKGERTFSPFVVQPAREAEAEAGRRRICARCGVVGHTARECEGPVRRGGDGGIGVGVRRVGGVGRDGFEGRDAGFGRPWEGGRQENVFDRRDGNEGGFDRQRDGGRVRDSYHSRPDTRNYGQQQERQPYRREPDNNYTARDERQPYRDRYPAAGAVSDARESLLQRPRFSQPDETPEPALPSGPSLSSRFTDAAPSRTEKPRRASRRDEDDDAEDEHGAERDERNARKAARKAQKASLQTEKLAERKADKAHRAENGQPVNLPEFVSVATLAQTLNVRYEAFVGRLERLGYDDVFPGKVLNAETSGMIAMEYGFDPLFEGRGEQEAEQRDLHPAPAVEGEDRDFLPTRPPVVTIMGHVDHGKTTILDYLRKSKVVESEAGGITQHIGAFSVPLASSGRTITFLDTPGHAAFLAMRQRGAHVTDIVILVVAADDSVKPQTLEALKHARAAGVPLIVAVNKVDKEAADVQRVKQDLARHGVEIEDFGGETQVVLVSGKTGQGMQELEEAVVTLSEILDHRAEGTGSVEGWVLEATTRKAGRVATVLVRRGTLRVGTVVVAGTTWARVRTLRNDRGEAVGECGPGMPVEVDGWREQPQAGDEVLQAPTEQKATDVVEYRVEKQEREQAAVDMEAINESRRREQEKREKEKIAADAAKRRVSAGEEGVIAAPVEEVQEEEKTGQISVPFIIKADVSGSAEAVAAYVMSVASPLIVPQILHSTVGQINESDVDLAAAAQGHIIAFNLPADENMKGAAESRGVKVLGNNIIYRVLDDVKTVLEERLPPVVSQKVVGEAEVGAAFEIGVGGRNKMSIAGCNIRNGVVGRGAKVRVLREGVKVYEGVLASLKNVKKDVQEMRKGTECGMGFEGGWEGFEVGDQVQVYEEMSEKRRL